MKPFKKKHVLLITAGERRLKMEAIIKRRIAQVVKGDQEAYTDIVDFYKDKVYQICYRMLGNKHEAEDVAQEAFLRAYLNIHTFKQELKFSSWLYRIATNLCIDRMRKKKPDYYLDSEVAGTDGLTLYSQIPSNQRTPDQDVENIELADTIQKEISKLPEKYRSVIVLRYIDELSLNEISDILNMPLGTVKTRIHRGRDALKEQLKNV